ncbi:MAG: imidazoleglycerol-phosphate dehydratase HisB [Nitrospiraceae bacterium]|nr:imidazoleglycerol-phosphate dehydratase HisB [Nitrospiraceae bacterium]
MSRARRAANERKTKETAISLELNLDGRGDYRVKTGMPFFDHMLSLMCRHGLMDVRLRAKGDVEVDYHHTVEDVGIVLGKALREALGGMEGIRRYGFASVPMDESIAQVSLDISGRPYLLYKAAFPARGKIKDFDAGLIEDFLLAFTASAGMTLHVQVPYGRNLHHMIEAIFKALGRALMEAVSIEPRAKKEPPSTKGRI